VGKPPSSGGRCPNASRASSVSARLSSGAAHTGHRLFFLGATDEVLTAMIEVLRRRYPNLVIAGQHNGYWSDDSQVLAAVRLARPHFLFLAIPSPRKEYWLSQHLDSLAVPFVMGVGGTFDVVAGKVRRAPRWVQRDRMRVDIPRGPGAETQWSANLRGNSAFLLLTAREWSRSR